MAKGLNRFLAVAGQQASYNGALGTKGMHSFQLYGQDEPIYDNNAYTIILIYYSGTLKMYTSYPFHLTSLRGWPEYHMT